MIDQKIVWSALIESILEVFPEYAEQKISGTSSLHALGANSVDRAEIIMLTMRRLALKVPLTTFASAKNLQDLSDAFYGSIQQQS